MINQETEIMTYRTMNAPMELVPFGIDEVANAPIKWKEVNEMIGHLTKTVYNKNTNKFTYTVPLKLVKNAIREINKVLSAEGMKKITTSKKTKEELIDELELVCYQEGLMYGFSTKKNKNLELSKKSIINFARKGLLTPDLGSKCQVRIEKKYGNETITEILLTGRNSIDARTWVNSAVETESTLRGQEALNGFGTIVETRMTCESNKNAATWNDISLANCVNENGVIGYAKKNKKCCQNCGEPAIIEWSRESVSTKNGQFLMMPLIKKNRAGSQQSSPFKVLGMESVTEVVDKFIDVIDETNTEPRSEYDPVPIKQIKEEVRVKRENIQPRLYPIHLQSKGGRVARKINGKTVWTDVFFQQLVFETYTGQCIAVWCAVECSGIESKKLLNRIYVPSPSRASVVVANSMMNNKELSFILSNKMSDIDEVVPQYFPAESCDVEDGAGVV
jgi:hypothetical protein